MQTRGIQAAVAVEHLEGVDVVLLCVDNFRTRALVSELVTRRPGGPIRLVNGGTGMVTVGGSKVKLKLPFSSVFTVLAKTF